MQARYSSTIKLRNIAKEVEKQRLGCGVQIFSQLMDRSKSWCCNFLNAAVEVKGVYPVDLMRLFTIEYNCVLFENKQEQMEGLLKNAIDSNICSTSASLDKIFKTIEFRDENGSYHRRYKIPREVFFGDEIPLAGNIYASKRKRGTYIFKEDAFIQYDKMLSSELKEKFSTGEIVRLQSKEISNYVKLMQLNENGSETATFPTETEEIDRIEKYISNRMKSLLNKEPSSCLSDYWLFATFYKYNKVVVSEQLYEMLRKWYGVGNNKEINLDNLFNVLQMERNDIRK